MKSAADVRTLPVVLGASTVVGEHSKHKKCSQVASNRSRSLGRL